MPARPNDWSVRVTDEAIIIESGSRALVLGLWTSRFGWWAVDWKTGDYQTPALTVPVLSPYGAPSPWPAILGSAFFGRTLMPLNKSQLPLTINDSSQLAAGAIAKWLYQVPLEIRRLVVPFGDLQMGILEEMWRQPEFSAFVATEMATGNLQFIYASLSLSSFLHRSTNERQTLIDRIMHEKRTCLLADLAGGACRRSALRYLVFFGDQMMAPDDYRTLLADPVGGLRKGLSSVLRTQGMELEDFISSVREINLRRVALILLDRHAAKLISQVVTATKTHFCLQNLADSLGAAIGDGDLNKWADEWFRRVAAMAAFPPPPLKTIYPLEPLSSLDAMRSEARKMRNCLADLIDKVFSGERYYYRWLGSERATVEFIVRNNSGLRIGAINGVGNRPVGKETYEEIERTCQLSAIAEMRRREPSKFCGT